MIDITDYVLFMMQSIPWLCLIGAVVCLCMAVYKDTHRKRILKEGIEQIRIDEMVENTSVIIAVNKHYLETGEDLTGQHPYEFKAKFGVEAFEKVLNDLNDRKGV